MPRPILKQFVDLRPHDFKQHPIWVNVHVLDYDEEWYEDTDEETFRPWLEGRPVGGNEMYLVSASIRFADGTEFEGFVTPVDVFSGLRDFGSLQPHVFPSSGRSFGFWHGLFRYSDLELDFYECFAKSPDQVFPIQFQALPGLTSCIAAGEIPGFLSNPDGEKVEITK